MHNRIADEILSKLRKLKQLADKGVAGEADVAKAMLEKVAKKHGIDLEALGIERKEFRVKAGGWRMQLLFQLCAVVCGVNEFAVRKGQSRNELVVECEECKWLEIVARFKILEKDYKEQLSLFYEAFVVCNGLALKNESKMPAAYSDAEQKKAEKVAKLAKGLTKSRSSTKQKNTQKALELAFTSLQPMKHSDLQPLRS